MIKIEDKDRYSKNQELYFSYKDYIYYIYNSNKHKDLLLSIYKEKDDILDNIFGLNISIGKNYSHDAIELICEKIKFISFDEGQENYKSYEISSITFDNFEMASEKIDEDDIYGYKNSNITRLKTIKEIAKELEKNEIVYLNNDLYQFLKKSQKLIIKMEDIIKL